MIFNYDILRTCVMVSCRILRINCINNENHSKGNDNRNISFIQIKANITLLRQKREVCSRKCSTFLRFALMQKKISANKYSNLHYDPMT